MVFSIEKPACRRQASTALWSRELAGPGVIRVSISPTAQRWRLRASRVEIARRRIAVLQSSRRRRFDLAEDDVDHPVEELVLVRDVVVERHRAYAELVCELAHRQRLDPAAVRERARGVAAPAPCSAALAACFFVGPLDLSYIVRVSYTVRSTSYERETL